ncbi:TspO/MBR family protein [Anaerorhabdus furcosa]|uniref:TspO/MBR family protein n=1 Tax=Anaerorhabdus furcosa TaxID=118967 RepID=A0A1T4NLS1_9FIRM|nr:TspO/MBR family protein [Anaerorhabdus furcosa]SJZ80230.1 TspO/MBR family protein [Anaerorhabdus furcosa]
MNKKIPSRYLVLVTTLFTLFANTYANVFKFNGYSTKDISDLYPNLFTPAPITFLIWTLIYGLLIVVVYRYFTMDKLSDSEAKVYNRVGYILSFSNILNGIWMLFWHMNEILIALIIMLGILVSLLAILFELKKVHQDLWFKSCFGIYTGWITIATIANIVVYLVSIQWDGFGKSPETWMVIITIVGLVITSLTAWKFRNPYYMMVTIWAYIGILIAHLSDTQNTLIIGTVSGCIAIEIVVLLLVMKGSLYNQAKQLK